jgi:hypothetical protein
MAYLKNPSFESGTAPWSISSPNASLGSYSITGLPAYAGNLVGLFQAFQPNVFVSQEVPIPVGNPAVLCSAAVASLLGGITGRLELTDKVNKSNPAVITPFNIQTAYAWQTVTASLDIDATVAGSVEVKFVMDQGFGNQMCIDFVSLV